MSNIIANFSWLANPTIGQNFWTYKKTPFQNGVLNFLLRKQPFFKFMHSLCENEDIRMWGKHIDA